MSYDVDPVLPDYFGDSCDWYDLPCHLTSFGEWLLGVLLWLPMKIWDGILDALLALLIALPLPVTSADISGAVVVMADLGWIAGLFNLQFGVTTVFTALVARFLLRRIPLVG